MKAKLLRKVRKEFGIFRYPNGIELYNGNIKTTTPTLVLKYDNTVIMYIRQTDAWNKGKEYYVYGKYTNEHDAIKYLKECMLVNIISTYKKYGVRRNNRVLQNTKVYYNENITNK